jgi:hypothetical protein
VVRRQHGAHLEKMAAFWQDCEVSIPNKPVPVPRSMMFRRSKKHFRVTKLELLKVESYNDASASTSVGSGSQRSHEEATETNTFMKRTNKTNTTTTTAKAIKKIVDEVDMESDPDCDCGELLRRKSAQTAAAVAAL